MRPELRCSASMALPPAVFSNEPERAVYDNVPLGRDLAAAERANALDAMEAAHAAVGVARFAAWVHESDEVPAPSERRGRALLRVAIAVHGLFTPGWDDGS